MRLVGNCLAIYLALYLVDSVAGGRFRVLAVWAAVVLAVVLASLNSPIRPLRRIWNKPSVALMTAVLTVLMNVLVLQIFIWVGSQVSATSFAWVLAVAALVCLLAGVINWLVGFKTKEKSRAASPQKNETRATRKREAGVTRPRS